MRILQVASEIAPFAKVGGLADVVTGLSRELAFLGHEVTVILPRYGVIDYSDLHATGQIDTCNTYYNNSWHTATFTHYTFDDTIQVCLVDTEGDVWQHRSSIYGNSADDIRWFLQFSRAVVDWVRSRLQWPFDLIHLHDWQASAVAGLIRSFDPLDLPGIRPKLVLTLHNLDYQGKCYFSELQKIGFELHYPSFRDMALDSYTGHANILKLGIEASDVVTTVSTTYAKETLSQIGGRGLDRVLQTKGSQFIGILNGIDYHYWNPMTDPFLPISYESTSPALQIRKAKCAAKEALLAHLGIELEGGIHTGRPLVASVARLVEQKGLPLIESVIQRARALNIDCVILGTASDQVVFDHFSYLNQLLRDEKRGAVVLQSSEKSAHLIFASSDIFLVPSLFEPCGLTQMIAMRYGSIPVVRKTGGLQDTVVDIDYPLFSDYVKSPNGFVFDHPDIVGIDSALLRAIRLFTSSPKKWDDLVKTAMNQDFSWKNPALKYEKIYHSQ